MASSPQREWNQAYASFLASSRVSSFISILPSLLNMTNMTCVADSPLLPKKRSQVPSTDIFAWTRKEISTPTARFARRWQVLELCVRPRNTETKALPCP